jgi:dienelactone hydrolase
MTRLLRPTRLLAVAAMAGVALLPAVGVLADHDAEPGTQAWYQRDVDNMVRGHGRLQDQYTNPAFHQELQWATLDTFTDNVIDQGTHPDRPIVTLGQWVPGGRAADPYRTTWEQDGRGVQVPFEYHNRYGARITGNVWAPKLPFADPVTGTATTGPLPGVVITTGSIQGFEEMYLWAAQGLAEAGYVVMTYDVQGQGQSETFGHQPDGSLWCNQDGCPGVPFQQAANFFEGTEEALVWFLSDRNPLRGLVDDARLGLAGHSLGATAVSQVGNREVPVPDDVFAAMGVEPFDIDIDAVIGWDNASVPETDAVTGQPLAPRVPTMGQNAEYFFNTTPRSDAGNPDSATGTFERFRAAGVPAMQVALRSSTHLEWTYIPLILPASQEGERVAMHYTLGWFDRWLKGGEDALAADGDEAVAQAVDAQRRLGARTFDGSADASAIGAGTWDLEAGNVPHTLEGEAVADQLSFYLRSALAFDGVDCPDLRHGCGDLQFVAPAADDGSGSGSGNGGGPGGGKPDDRPVPPGRGGPPGTSTGLRAI